MRSVTEIILHCTATPEGREVSLAEVDGWHRRRGFACIGYHYLIHLDGSVDEGRPLTQVGAHCAGHNQHSVGVCYVGGLSCDGKPKDTRTERQRVSLRNLIRELQTKFPQATVHCHNEYAPKACPCFSIKDL